MVGGRPAWSSSITVSPDRAAFEMPRQAACRRLKGYHGERDEQIVTCYKQSCLTSTVYYELFVTPDVGPVTIGWSAVQDSQQAPTLGPAGQSRMVVAVVAVVALQPAAVGAVVPLGRPSVGWPGGQPGSSWAIARCSSSARLASASRPSAQRVLQPSSGDRVHRPWRRDARSPAVPSAE
jgi:hypothetical protein